jgi:hypothetical protein
MDRQQVLAAVAFPAVATGNRARGGGGGEERRRRTIEKRDNPAPEVNFLNFLNFRGMRNGRKLTIAGQ